MDTITNNYTTLFKSGVQYAERDLANFIICAYDNIRIRQKIQLVERKSIKWDNFVLISNGVWTYSDRLEFDFSRVTSSNIRIVVSLAVEKDDQLRLIALEESDDMPDDGILIGRYTEDDTSFKYETIEDFEIKEDLEQFMTPDIKQGVTNEGSNIVLPKPIHNYKTLTVWLGEPGGLANKVGVSVPVPYKLMNGQTMRNTICLGQEVAPDGYTVWATYMLTLVIINPTTVNVLKCRAIRHNTSFKMPKTYPHNQEIKFNVSSIQCYRY